MDIGGQYSAHHLHCNRTGKLLKLCDDPTIFACQPPILANQASRLRQGFGVSQRKNLPWIFMGHAIFGWAAGSQRVPWRSRSFSPMGHASRFGLSRDLSSPTTIGI